MTDSTTASAAAAGLPSADLPSTGLPSIGTDEILLELDAQVLTITFNRPQKLNSVTQEMSDALVVASEWANESDAVRAVVLTGAGERAFCAGSDIRQLDTYATPWDFRNRGDYCDALRLLRKPVIAAVNGYAFGGGLETALTCDIRLASTTASFAAPEIKLGWIGGGGMSTFLGHSIGASNAALMLMTGDPIDASRALAWGLVSELVEPGSLVARAQELARTIASRPPIAAETAKANLRAAYNLPQDAAIAYERDLQTVTFATEDAAEGRAAFAEKRQGLFHRR
ncbi:enoyl-CoA hydratase/isomerase family protein [Herbiconiux sp. CPCC 203407]|uniref:Enoyl-CoA hydratase/isomerase family protein n=1 Tax=Herbiconiux oxytropis TaxID=2970915 RepID=A0AA41XHW6_9MICO|nr:enoyl-CoA hydratase/isomerase family protein [Herbiconiux oxytropis]MCS5723122.1 enoyl-CoA hydratase/isomerase family protein [Herbiconiux oxytropis]MCS5725321.1 enoyl-CoA hydratase/isomerase family protein [Herbiconiux oxytropis]